ncbi:MAG: hypothetical protein EP338_03590 [Bacteroidetes bacterium]|nr:MAG: hypothetical protein EP338_03590 [Bacteroidota bacterium]
MKKNILLNLFFLLGVASYGQETFKHYDTLFRDNVMTDFDLATVYFRKQKRLIKTDNDRVDYYLNAMAFYRRSSMHDSAKISILKAGKYLDAKDQMRQTDYYRLLGKIYRDENDFKKSNEVMLGFLKRTKLKRPYWEASLQNLIANNYNSLEQYDKAIQSGLKVKELLAKDHTEEANHLQVINYTFLGNVFEVKSDYDSSLYYFDRASEYIEPGDTLSLARLKSSMAVTLSLSGDTIKAIGYYRRSIQILEKTSYKIHLVHAYYNLGDAYLSSKPDSALYFMKKANVLSEQMDYPLIRAYALQGIGRWYFDAGETDSSIYYNELSIPFLEQVQHTVGLVRARMNLAESYYERKEEKKALEHARWAYSLSHTVDTPKMIEESSHLLSRIFHKQGALDSSIFYSDIYHRVKDSLMNADVLNRVRELNIKYDTKLKDEENSRLAIELEREQLESRFWIVTFIMILVLLIGILAYFYQKTRTQKQKLLLRQKQIEQEKIHRDLLLGRLKESMSALQSKNELITALENDRIFEEDQETVSERLIEKLLDRDDQMQFVVEFELVYQGFFDRLREHLKEGESLSKNDQRLSALVKLNLSNKEIAEILFISPNSVKKAKSRLFTKLEHPIDVSTGDFIRSL